MTTTTGQIFVDDLEDRVGVGGRGGGQRRKGGGGGEAVDFFLMLMKYSTNNSEMAPSEVLTDSTCRRNEKRHTERYRQPNILSRTELRRPNAYLFVTGKKQKSWNLLELVNKRALPSLSPDHALSLEHALTCGDRGQRGTNPDSASVYSDLSVSTTHAVNGARHRHLCDTRHRRTNTRGFLTTSRQSSRAPNTIGCISTPVSLVSQITLSSLLYCALSPLQPSLHLSGRVDARVVKQWLSWSLYAVL